jgi:hypothetical protein
MSECTRALTSSHQMTPFWFAVARSVTTSSDGIDLTPTDTSNNGIAESWSIRLIDLRRGAAARANRSQERSLRAKILLRRNL